MNTTLFSLAFSAGLITFLNPCGFALLPVYLAYYFKNEQLDNAPVWKRLFYGIIFGLCVSLGFMVIFSIIGFIVTSIGSRVLQYIGFFDFAIGLLLVIIGFMLLLGKNVNLSFITNFGERLKENKFQNKYFSFFLYGMGFALASLGCTLPIFLAIVAASVKMHGIVNSMVVFIVYAAGMSISMVAFTIAVALSKKIVEVTLRKWLPYIYRLGAIIVILAGFYLMYNQIVIGRLFG
ncbi:MAG TPA: cytochrome c biogenesis CcdA family protein [Candidatus Nanoarchaeia archaeon]|nr:cytochrome c biogenesis CcdA family protein [Candidatus Nanoarchaeia archaeon]